MRHRRAHVSPALIKVAAEREEREGRTLRERMEVLIERTERLLEAAELGGGGPGTRRHRPALEGL